LYLFMIQTFISHLSLIFRVLFEVAAPLS
jgi:hypothetical protein